MKRLFIIASVVPFLACIAAQSAPTTDDKAIKEPQIAAPDSTTKNAPAPDHPTITGSQIGAPDSATKNAPAPDQPIITTEKQSNEKCDVDVTTRLRKEVMAQKGFSTNAQNVKISTENGMLTLRGPVDNENEKKVIGSLARKCSGATKISNLLEVKAPQ